MIWFVIGWLLGSRRRWQSAEEREWRRCRGHPWAFGLVGVLLVGAVGVGAWGWAVALLTLAGWLVIA